MIADIEREADGRRKALQGHEVGWFGESRKVPVSRTGWSPAKTLLAIAASIALLLGVSFLLRPDAVDREIATITGLNGAVQWTGDGGQVVRDFAAGYRLRGGTIEGLAPFSWFELQFKDGSKIAISGNSVLTFSELRQKQLHLKRGAVSARVEPQPPGRPMLIQTPSAQLEVLGTRFEVEAGLAATLIDVSEGKVRVKRLADGATIVVPAQHRAVAAADRDLTATPAPQAVNRWISHLQLGPERTLGKWLSGTDGGSPTLGAVPYTTQHGFTIYTMGFGVSQCQGPKVMLMPGSSLRFRGRLAASHPIWFGVSVRHLNGDFAGRFQIMLPATNYSPGKEFTVTLPLDDLQLDPSLHAMRHKLPDKPFNLVVESIWCHTLDQPAGLEIAATELIAPNSQ